MKIILTGPRSVGKTTVGLDVAKKLNLEFHEGDKLMQKKLESVGGLSNVIESKKHDEIIKNAIEVKDEIYSKDDFLYDMAGGALILAEKYKDYYDMMMDSKSKSVFICLIPFNDIPKSIELLYNREINREHFKELDSKTIKENTRKYYLEFLDVYEKYCDKIIYTENKSVNDISEEIISYLQTLDHD